MLQASPRPFLCRFPLAGICELFFLLVRLGQRGTVHLPTESKHSILGGGTLCTSNLHLFRAPFAPPCRLPQPPPLFTTPQFHPRSPLPPKSIHPGPRATRARTTAENMSANGDGEPAAKKPCIADKYEVREICALR